MTIQQGIEKAVEGGYHRGQIGTSPIVEINCDFAITETKGERNHYGLAWVWLDPLFWQSLGKAMGWPTDICKNCGEVNRCLCGGEAFVPGWEYNWLLFIHHLSEGKTAESFFANL